SSSSIITPLFSYFFFFTAPAPTEIYPLSLHDALPICSRPRPPGSCSRSPARSTPPSCRTSLSRRTRSPTSSPTSSARSQDCAFRSEEHTSELQSRGHLVCRLLLEKKKKKKNMTT